MMKMVDINKHYKTRSGERAKIICMDREPPFSVVALIGDKQEPVCYTKMGKIHDSFHIDDDKDLIEAEPIRHEINGTIAVFPNQIMFGWTDIPNPIRDESPALRNKLGLISVHISWEENGRGLLDMTAKSCH